MGMTTWENFSIYAIDFVVEACRLDGYDNIAGTQLPFKRTVVEACRLDGYDNFKAITF